MPKPMTWASADLSGLPDLFSVAELAEAAKIDRSSARRWCKANMKPEREVVITPHLPPRRLYEKRRLMEKVEAAKTWSREIANRGD